MTIGLDLTSLQGAHRMRGIGYTLIQLINNLPQDLREENNFIFYYYQTEATNDPLELLKLEGIDYEVRPISPASKKFTRRLPGKLNVFVRFLNQLADVAELYRGDSRIEDLGGVDVFLQTDQAISLPKGRKFKKAFIAYDVIPYILEWDYLWNYSTARLHGLPRQAAIRCSVRRWMYIHKLRINSRRADQILSISNATKKDFIKYVSPSKKKIETVPLGVMPADHSEADRSPQMHRYVTSSWGYLKKPFAFDDTPYLLFVGGADSRRKLDELIIAFNHLRAQGHPLKLVLAGDTMQGPLNIPTVPIQKALSTSSYLEDIIFMGFVDDEQRDWLYKNALAFIFPSRYEGFGLPVLEAFSHRCPVISYRNEATLEVAKDTPIYCDGPLEIIDCVATLLDTSQPQLEKLKKESLQRAQQYTWEKSSRNIIKALG